MSDRDVHRDDMPDELDALLDDLRAAAADTPPPVVGGALATLFREGAAPVAAPRPRHRGLRVLVAGVVAGVAVGGLGVAGALPGPVQRRVADVVDTVGVHLPDGRPDPTTTTTSTTKAPATTTTTARPAITPTTEDGPGRAGEEHGRPDDPGSKGKGRGKGADDEGRGGSEGRRRNPKADADVDLPDDSGRGRPDDDGGSN